MLFVDRAGRSQAPAQIRPGPGSADKAAFENVCGTCHSPTMVDGFRSEADWREAVAKMVELGARGTDQQMDGVMRYLLRVWTRINIDTATAKQMVQTIGLSDSVAERIVDGRAKGPYENLRVPDQSDRLIRSSRKLQRSNCFQVR